MRCCRLLTYALLPDRLSLLGSTRTTTQCSPQPRCSAERTCFREKTLLVCKAEFVLEGAVAIWGWRARVRQEGGW